MENPILVFFVIVLLLIFNLIRIVINTTEHKKWFLLFPKILLIFCIGFFSFAWFVPLHVGWNKETAIHKFRFQVFEVKESNNENPSSFTSVFFEFRPSKYGWFQLNKRIGTWNDYFKTYQSQEKYYEYPEK
ncbi:hypothetical protein ACQY1Q_11915 [Tenacibaculum sp. TC6]|uniref:hypothetical protein n=1 Tax=Tenacibaculum sp. TC6 TaxID=3423223 RepID=UPI003D36DA72